MPIENLQAFYRKHYQPDNAMLVVAGQFDEKKALGVHRQVLRPAQEAGPQAATRRTPQEPAQDGERNVTLRRVGSVGAAGVVYHIPAAAHPDFAAVQVLEDCLTNEPGGRLYKALVETKKATERERQRVRGCTTPA